MYADTCEYVTRGHPCKIFKRHCSGTARSSFFSERYSLSSEVVDFSSLASFKRSVNSVDLSKYLVD